MVSWGEYVKLSEVLDDEDFKLLTLMFLHPELDILDIQKCLEKDVKDEKVIRYSPEGIRLKMISLKWKIEKWRGDFTGTFDKYFEKNKKQKQLTREIKNEMIERFCQLFYKKQNNAECIRQVLEEFDYPMSYATFLKTLYDRLGKNYIDELLKISESMELKS